VDQWNTDEQIEAIQLPHCVCVCACVCVCVCVCVCICVCICVCVSIDSCNGPLLIPFSLTYSLTHSLTYPLSLTHSLTPSLTHSLTYSLTHSLTDLAASITTAGFFELNCSFNLGISNLNKYIASSNVYMYVCVCMHVCV